MNYTKHKKSIFKKYLQRNILFSMIICACFTWTPQCSQKKKIFNLASISYQIQIYIHMCLKCFSIFWLVENIQKIQKFHILFMNYESMDNRKAAVSKNCRWQWFLESKFKEYLQKYFIHNCNIKSDETSSCHLEEHRYFSHNYF